MGNDTGNAGDSSFGSNRSPDREDRCQRRESDGQFSEQDPGPRGSPHEPQGAGAALRDGDDGVVLTAKTDNCLSSSVLVQDGQIGVRSARVRNSK